jgi:hypothetical protein
MMSRRSTEESMRTWPATMGAPTLIALVLLPFGVLVGGTFLYGVMKRFGGLQQELAIVYFIGLIVLALLVGLKVTALLYSHVGISDRNSPMGLPQGSIRAILALGLVLIFAVMAMGLFSQVNQAGHIVSSNGLTQAQLDAIPIAQIVGQRARPEASATVFDVDRRLPGSGTSDDIAKQLVTILGTLVVAVSAFYFGANSVQAASAAAGPRRSGGSSPGGAIAIAAPKPVVPLKPDGGGYVPFPVEVTTDPPGLAVTAHVIGDDGGSVSEPSAGSGKFVYVPAQPTSEVLLRFALASAPGTSTDLVVPRGAATSTPSRATPATPPGGPQSTPGGSGETVNVGRTRRSSRVVIDPSIASTEGVDEQPPESSVPTDSSDVNAPSVDLGAPAAEQEDASVQSPVWYGGSSGPTPQRVTAADASFEDPEDNTPRAG